MRAHVLRVQLLLALLGTRTGGLNAPRLRSKLRAAPRRARALASGAGGDLLGGSDAQRNERVRELKRAFYGQASAAPADDALARTHGVYLDLPVCRWSFTVLPHAQLVLNVFQPEYVHLFESLLATAAPLYYAHVLLPGGLANLANPDFALRPDSQAPLTGTLMRVIRADRQPDARLRLVVQGLGRVRVLRETQRLPFSRADVRLLADAEELDAELPLARAALGAVPTAEVGAAPAVELDLLCAAAAAARAAAWTPFESADASRVPGMVQERYYGVQGPWAPPLVPYNASAAAASRAAAEGRVVATLSELLAARGAGTPWCARAEWEEDVARNAERLRATRALGSASGVADADRVAELEAQLWCDLDALLRRLHAIRPDKSGPMPVPTVMLGLLPRAPPQGWPADFRCAAVAAERAELAQEQPALGFVAVGGDEEYPALRRAQRLSYVVWDLLSREGESPQPVLEAPSVAERLTLAIWWIDGMTREVMANR